MPNHCSDRRVPRYRLHKASGQAVVTLNGRDIYLGVHGSESSRDEYERQIARWVESGRRSPAADAAVVEIILAYFRFAKGYYLKDGHPTNEVRMIQAALKVVRTLYGRTSAADFGPRALKACRDSMIRKGWCRSHINKQVDRIKRMFKWAVSEEIVPGELYQRLRCVAGLKRGRTIAREGRRVQPVSEADFQETLAHLPPVVCDMVQVQRLTGARPGEICCMRPRDIDRTGEVWAYIPESHKTEHYERERIIFLGPKAQKLLTPYLLRPAETYCFSPRESDRRRRELQNEQRKTAISCGNRIGSNRKRRPQRSPGEKYDRNTYGRAVRRAAEKAGVATWSPHRLRHSFASEARKRFGLEAAQVVLGHAHASTTEIYAQRDNALAARVALEVG